MQHHDTNFHAGHKRVLCFPGSWHTKIFLWRDSKNRLILYKTWNGCTCIQKHLSYMWQLYYRGKKIKLFLFGDYQYLSIMYGISGASGRNTVFLHTCVHVNPAGCHCCQFCSITSEELKTAPESRQTQAEIRTLATLKRSLHLVKVVVIMPRATTSLSGSPFLTFPCPV